MYLRPKYQWDPVTLPPDETVLEAADVMDSRGIGCVIIAGADRKPVGVLTDRDLVSRVIAPGLDPEATKIADVMTVNPVVADKHTPVTELLELMRVRGIRRIPLVESGKIQGVVSFDDVVLTLSVELWNVSEAMREELRETWRTTAKRRRHETRDELLVELRDRVMATGSEIRERTAKELRALADRISR